MGAGPSIGGLPDALTVGCWRPGAKLRKRLDDRIPTPGAGRAIWTLRTVVAGTRVTRRDLQRYEFLFRNERAGVGSGVLMPYRFRVLALLFLLIFIMYLDRLCISVAGPRIQQELHLTPVQWGWVIGAFTIAYAAFEIPSGALGDRIGPRRVLTRIVLWWSAFTAATGLVRTYPVLLLVRFLFGAGEAGSFPNSALTISRWTPERERARSLSVLWIATGIGGIATPLIVVAIQKRYGWRPSFWLFGSLGILWSVVWQSWFRDRPSEKAGVPQDEIKIIGYGPVARHSSTPWARLLRDRNLLLLMLMYHCYCWGAYFYLSWIHTYLQVGR